MQQKKNFRLLDSVLMTVVVILVAEAAAPTAGIGNSQFFWWIALFISFFIPYGLVSAELGTAYQNEGGIYAWINHAYGPKAGSRAAWYYWINFPLWMASLAVLFTSTLTKISGWEITSLPALLLELFFLIIVNIVGNIKIGSSKWLLNIAAIFKALIMISLGILGIYTAFTQGSANEYDLASFIPTFDMSSISLISVIIFNFLGFEVVTTLSSDMPDPKKQIPKAIFLGGIFIMAFYMLASFGIGVAIPASDITVDGGLLDSIALLAGDNYPLFTTLIGIMFIVTLFANLISWSLGVNTVACYAAKNSSLPKIFAKCSSDGTPIGTAAMNFIVASILVMISHCLENQDVFWNFFALNMVTLLLSYVLIFPAFRKLRQIDASRTRPFKVGGSPLFINLITYIPMCVLILSIILLIIPFNVEEMDSKLPLLFGTICSLVVGEGIAWRVNKNYNEKERGYNIENN